MSYSLNSWKESDETEQLKLTHTHTLFVVSLEIPTTSHLQGKKINLASTVP